MGDPLYVLYVLCIGAAIVELSQAPELRRKMGKMARDHIIMHHDINRVWPKVLDALSSKKI